MFYRDSGRGIVPVVMLELFCCLQPCVLQRQWEGYSQASSNVTVYCVIVLLFAALCSTETVGGV